MIVRRPRVAELEKLKQLHEPFSDQFPFPDLSHVSSIYVVEDDGQILGFGTLQPILEATIVLDQKATMQEKMSALRLLQQKAEQEVGDGQIHIFVQAKKFLNLMKKRFGYKYTKGIALVKIVSKE
jgi:hypothetical protein